MWFFSLTPDWDRANELRTRAITAQYLPDAQSLVAASVAAPMSFSVDTVDYQQNDGTNMDNVSLSLAEFNSLINNIGAIWHPFQGDFSIMDVRDIVIYLAENVGVFDQWFRYRGTNRPGNSEDFAHIPRSLADGNFFITNDEDTGHIQVIQVMGFQNRVWNRGLERAVENDDYLAGLLPTPPRPSGLTSIYSANWPTMGEIIFSINYFYDQEGREVVEVEVVEFLNHYNNVYVIGYKFLRNIKDTSFSRYTIQKADVSYNDLGGNTGTDIDSNRPYGVMRDFLHIDYTDPYNINFLIAGQSLAALYNNSVDTGFVQYLHLSNGVLSMVESEFAFIYSQEQLMANVRTDWRQILGRNRMYAESVFTQHYNDDYLTRSSSHVTHINRFNFDQTAFDNIYNSAVSLVKGVGITNQVTLNIANGLSDNAEMLEQRVWNLLEAIVANLIEQSFLRTNYQEGLAIRYNAHTGRDITDFLHPSPDWEVI